MGYYADQAKMAIAEGKWVEATIAWTCEGSDYGRAQANACKTIAQATELGDQFREKIKGLNEKVRKHEITTYEYMKALEIAHDEVYNK